MVNDIVMPYAPVKYIDQPDTLQCCFPQAHHSENTSRNTDGLAPVFVHVTLIGNS